MTNQGQAVESKHVAIYVRVSTRDKGQDTANRLDQLHDFCHANDWRVVREYQDHESGGKAERQAFRAMMADARTREFDVVLFWALDSFSRESGWETHQYLRQLDESGVRFRSFTEPYLDSCGMFRDAVISILAVIAKQERIRLSERLRAGLDRAITEGTKSSRPVGRPRVVFRRDEVVRLRKEGVGWSKIARQTGISSGSARRAYVAAMREGQPISRRRLLSFAGHLAVTNCWATKGVSFPYGVMDQLTDLQVETLFKPARSNPETRLRKVSVSIDYLSGVLAKRSTRRNIV